MDPFLTFSTTQTNKISDYYQFMNFTYKNTKQNWNFTEPDLQENNQTDNSSKNYEEDNEGNWYAFLLLILVLLGILGNTLVCVAICWERRLQSVTNYFLLSLGVADLLVSLIVMPLGMIVELLGYWPFGIILCDIWATSDVLCCTSSIMHMCMVSLDRYLGINNPLKTRNKSKTVVIIKIIIVWLVSLLISSPITVLVIVDETNLLVNQQCTMNNQHFIIFGSLFAFFIPLTIMVVIYALTVHLLKKQAKLCCDNAAGGVKLRRSFTSSKRKQKLLTMGTSYNGHSTLHPKISTSSDSDEGLTLNPDDNSSKSTKLQSIKYQIAKRASHLLNQRKSSLGASRVANEQKASKVLGIVFFSFVICWAPFFTMNIITGLCTSCFIPPRVFAVCLWLGWASSIINPLIYTIFNRMFKETFLRLLKCECCCIYQKSKMYNGMIRATTCLTSLGHESVC